MNSHDFINYVYSQTLPVIVTYIEPSVISFYQKQNRDLIQELRSIINKREVNERFRLVPSSEFCVHDSDDFCSMFISNMKDTGKMFCHPDFYKTFEVNSRENFYGTQTYSISSMTQNSPWFEWLKRNLSNSLMFENGNFVDIPSGFLFIYPINMYKEALEKNTKRNFNMPDWMRSYIRLIPGSLLLVNLDNKENAFVEFANQLSSESDEKLKEFSLFAPIDSEFSDLGNYFDQYQEYIINSSLFMLKNKISDIRLHDNWFKRKRIQLVEYLMLASLEIGTQQYFEARETLQDIKNKTDDPNILEYVDLYQTICSILCVDEQSEKINLIMKIIPNFKELTMFRKRLNRAIISLFLIEDFNPNSKEIRMILKLIIFSGYRGVKKWPGIHILANAIIFERISIFYYRWNQMRKFVLYIFQAGLFYTQSGMKYHALRCFSFCHYAINSIHKDVFICGNSKTNEFLPCSLYWHEMGNYCLWHLMKILGKAKQYQSALRIVVLLLSAPANRYINDLDLFILFHPYFNKTNLSSLNVKQIPLIHLDTSQIMVLNYGDINYFGYKSNDFKHLNQYMSKKFRVKKDFLDYWKKEKNKVNLVVCGEETIITINIINFRTQPILIENINLEEDIANKSLIQTFPSKDNIPNGCKKTIRLSFKSINSGNFSIKAFNFTYWALINDTLSLPPLKFTSLDKQPSLEIKFIDFPKQLYLGECKKFCCQIKNIGDEDTVDLNVIYDSTYWISFIENSIIDNDISENNLGEFKAGETKLFYCYVHGHNVQKKTIHFVFNFKGTHPIKWRHYYHQEEVIVIEREKVYTKLFCHPKSIQNLLLYTNIKTKEKTVYISKIFCKNLCSSKNQETKPIQPNSSLTFLHSLSPNDNDNDEYWRKKFCEPYLAGHLLLNIPEYKLDYQFSIKENDETLKPFHYVIFAPSIIKIGDEMQKVISIKINIKNNSQKEYTNLFISPFQNTKSSFTQNIFWTSKKKYFIEKIKPTEVQSYDFQLCVMSKGIYDIGAFNITKKDSLLYQLRKSKIIIVC